MSETPVWLTSYLARGFSLVFYPTQTKHPTSKTWHTQDYAATDYHEGDNVGVKLGVELAPGQFLIDVDFDWKDAPPALAGLLPSTGFTFTRPGRPLSHAFYTVSTPLAIVTYDDLDGSHLVECRGTTVGGAIGHQTMLPPSVHPTGEVLTLRDGTIAHDDTVPRRVLLYALACLFYKYLGSRGFLHGARLALSGFLLSLGLTPDEVIDVAETLAAATGNSVSDVKPSVTSTVNRLRRGEKVQGKTALAEILGEDGKKILALARTYCGGDPFSRSGKGDRINPESQDNIRQALDLLDATLVHDQFTNKLLVSGTTVTRAGALDDRAYNDLYLAIDTEYHFKPSFDFFERVVKHTAYSNPVHPVKEYLSPLVWDGVARLDTWLIAYGGAEDSAYTRAVSSMVLIAAVRRIRQPGCKFDEMLVLESKQGMSKSSALRTLCPRDEWFSDDLPLNADSKRLIEATLGKWILEAADLAGKRKTEVEQLKAMLSRQVDGPARMAWERVATERPRHFIIVGTTNSVAYLTDPTGARRFWPVKMARFDVEGLKAVRDQLWAEASTREAKGESIRLREELWSAAGDLQEARREMDAWEELIGEMVNVATPHSDGRRRIVTSDIWDVLGIEVARRDRYGALRISEVMQRLGFSRTRIKMGNKTVVGYLGEQESLDFSRPNFEDSGEGTTH